MSSSVLLAGGCDVYGLIMGHGNACARASRPKINHFRLFGERVDASESFAANES